MMTSREIVEALDKYIIGQEKAKRAVAIALRNRYRRTRLDEKELQNEICPKNIIMMGPTGVGKTEIARRLAKLVDAPFLKVEATKFTEVGYVGRDVDSMIRDLVEIAVHMTKELRFEAVQERAIQAAEMRVVALIRDSYKPENSKSDKAQQVPLDEMSATLKRFFSDLAGGMMSGEADDTTNENAATDGIEDAVVLGESEQDDTQSEGDIPLEEDILRMLREGAFDDTFFEIMVTQSQNPSSDAVFAMGIDINIGEMFGGMMPRPTKKKKAKIPEIMRIFTQEEADKLIDMDDVIQEAIERTEQTGIIFIDEMDKIAVSGRRGDHDVSREGVQRDILPIVEGCTVATKYGMVKSDHVLFIAAGAFHMAKVSDLIPELQGRFPIRVELNALTKDDFVQILTTTQNAAIKQYKSLLATDNVFIEFTDTAIDLIAEYAYNFNESFENIGARRLHTILETLLDDISFEAGENGDKPVNICIDAEYVKSHITEDIAIDLRKYIL